MFVNRDQELIALENRYNSGEAEFVILYGRRRVGKTELLTQVHHYVFKIPSK